MSEAPTCTERAAYYREQAAVAEQESRSTVSAIMSESYRKLARDWLELAESAEKLHR